jgi:hypothetical protein
MLLGLRVIELLLNDQLLLQRHVARDICACRSD